jgi:2,3-bisphosphoglycerate-independent phosphoglycerate mutase
MRKKWVVLLGDGMGDYPMPELENRTPLEVAATPAMDYLAERGMVGMVRTIPSGMPKGSDVANLSILGYDPRRYYSGRAPLEAASLGLSLSPEEVVYRCNLVSVSCSSATSVLETGTMVDYSAGHISSREAAVLMRFLDEELGEESCRFHPGVSYRNLLVIRGGPEEVCCTPPHDIPGRPLWQNLPRGKGAEVLISLMRRSYQVLSRHPINMERQKSGKLPANLIWLWGQGREPCLPSFAGRYGLTGSIVSAVDLIKGIGKCAGLQVLEVPGATGGLDTNYEGKAEALLRSLEEVDFCFLHLEAPDEAAHNGDLHNKIHAIEQFDRRIIQKIIDGLHGCQGIAVLLLCDHLTPLAVRTHTDDPVPFLISSLEGKVSPGRRYNEAAGRGSPLCFDDGFRLMEYFLQRAPSVP